MDTEDWISETLDCLVNQPTASLFSPAYPASFAQAVPNKGNNQKSFTTEMGGKTLGMCLQHQNTNYQNHKESQYVFENNSHLVVDSTHMTPTNYTPMISPSFNKPMQFQYTEQDYQFPSVLDQHQPDGWVASLSGVVPQQYQKECYEFPEQATHLPAPPLLNSFTMEPLPNSKPEKEISKNRSKSKKKINSFVRQEKPKRVVRPKVVPSKGAVQCAGMNIKKGIQCKNAALMEFIGPRPIYCAEHIELDVNSIYQKCLSSYGKEAGDGKGCKEVVLKEFSFCYKHFDDRLATFSQDLSGVEQAKSELVRVSDILTTLEAEATQAKKARHDLFQRKNKLIPKFVKMKASLADYINKTGPFTGDYKTDLITKSVDVKNVVKVSEKVPDINYHALPAEMTLFPSDFNLDLLWTGVLDE